MNPQTTNALTFLTHNIFAIVGGYNLKYFIQPLYDFQLVCLCVCFYLSAQNRLKKHGTGPMKTVYSE